MLRAAGRWLWPCRGSPWHGSAQAQMDAASLTLPGSCLVWVWQLGSITISPALSLSLSPPLSLHSDCWHPAAFLTQKQ